VEDDVFIPKPNREAADDGVGRRWLLWLSPIFPAYSMLGSPKAVEVEE
jgi:hypothetical protein